MNKSISYIYLLLFSLAFSTLSFGQNDQPATDTIYHYEDNSLYKQQKFYEKWKEKAAKHKWTKELFNILFSAPTATTPKLITKESLARSYINYEGKVIKEITLKIIKPFGEKVNGLPTDSTNSKLKELGNNIHTRTKKKHLRRLLTIYEGQTLDIKLLEDNEENLRALDYVDELFISITPLTENDIKIDFLIKERFSWSLSYQAHSFDAHKIKLYNKNLWGRGHYARFSYFYNPTKKVVNSLGLEYTIPSIGKSLISATAIVERNNSYSKYSLDLNREFIDYRTNYAGGFKLNFFNRAERVPTNPIAVFPNSINYHEIDVWSGINLPYNLEKNHKYARYRKAITARAYRIKFTEKPEIKADSNVFLLNTTGVLLGYNVAQKQLYRSNLIYNYGRVENIPYGHLAQLFVGGVFNQWQRKGYLAANIERAYYSQKNDYYFALRLCGGTFFNRNKFLDGLINAEARYISRLYKFRSTQHRHFFKLRYLMGFNPTSNILDINESEGLHNLKSKVAGDRKLVLNVEDVFFTPYTIAGFRAAFYSFADIAYISNNNSLVENSKDYYVGIGLGVRLHNNNFIFETFQISFSLFLKRPEDVNFFRPDASSIRREKFRDFQIGKPYFYFEQETLR